MSVATVFGRLLFQWGGVRSYLSGRTRQGPEPPHVWAIRPWPHRGGPLRRSRAVLDPSQGRLLGDLRGRLGDRKSTRLNSSHVKISYAVFCLKKKKPSVLQIT